MKTALSLSTPEEWTDATKLGADFREIRIDLIGDKLTEKKLLELCREKKDDIPCIATIRSINEGGGFSGSPEEWKISIEPWINCAEYIDIERDFSKYAKEIKKRDTKIIASAHLGYMPENKELEELKKNLQNYGDIPKIVVTPKNLEDIADFIKFTVNIKKPAITSVMGEEFKMARIPLLLFGSMIIYCHNGKESAKGQYHIADVKKIMELI